MELWCDVDVSESCEKDRIVMFAVHKPSVTDDWGWQRWSMRQRIGHGGVVMATLFVGHFSQGLLKVS